MIRILLSIVLPVSLFAQSPKLIKEVWVNGQVCVIENNIIEIKSSENLAIIFEAHPSMRYAYQLEGVDETIIQSDQPFAKYAPLTKGAYYFNIYNHQAISMNVGTPAPLLTVIVKDSFMDSWWFVPLLVLYLLLLFGGASYFILLSNFRNKEKVYDLRNDWTNKLHNDIGGDLSSVSLRLDSLKRKLATMEPQMQAGVLKTYDILKSIQKKLRFVFDLVDPKKNSLHVMLGDIEDFAQENFTLTNTQFNYKNELKPDIAYNIDIGRINKLYLAMKEAVNNCMKYSEATLASLHIQSSKEGLHLELKDNGKGFDTTVPPKGNGIKNLQQYAREGFMDLQIQSEPGKGTTITILVPNL